MCQDCSKQVIRLETDVDRGLMHSHRSTVSTHALPFGPIVCNTLHDRVASNIQVFNRGAKSSLGRREAGVGALTRRRSVDVGGRAKDDDTSVRG